MTSFIIFGISLFICLIMFVIDERRRRTTNGTKAIKWFCLKTDEEANTCKEYPYEHEVGFQLIFNKLPNIKFLGNFTALIVFFVVIPWLLVFFAAIADGTLCIPGEGGGFLEYPPTVMTPSVLVTVAVGFYLFRCIIENAPRGFVSIGQANDRTEKSKAFINGQLEATAKYLMQTPESRGGKALMIDLSFLALLAIIVVIILSVDILIPPKTLWYASSDYFWGHLVWLAYLTIFVCYFCRVGLSYVGRLILSMHFIGKKLYEKEVLRVKPVHPDKAGGLSGFGKLAWRINVLLILLIAIQLVWFLVGGGINVAILITLVISIILIPFFFIFPLRELHKAMKQAKCREMDILSDQFNEHYWTMKAWIEGKNEVTNKHGRYAQESLERVLLLYDRASQMPVWPFDRNTLEKVSVTVIVPVVILLIQVLIIKLG